MDAQDKKELQVYVSRKPAPSMVFSLVLHAFMILFMLLYGLDTPELLKPIIIEMGGQREDDLIVMDDEPFVNQEVIDWMAKIRAQQDAEALAKTKLEPDFKPADISPISDPIFNPEPQKGSMSVTDINPLDLLSSIATDRTGSNSDSENIGNPLTGTMMSAIGSKFGQVGVENNNLKATVRELADNTEDQLNAQKASSDRQFAALQLQIQQLSDQLQRSQSVTGGPTLHAEPSRSTQRATRRTLALHPPVSAR